MRKLATTLGVEAMSLYYHLPNKDAILTEIAIGHALLPGYSYANEFEIGLDLILDSLGQRRDTQGWSRALG